MIISSLESRYGSNILLSPRGNALDSLLWVVPLTVLVSGVLVWATVARRRS
jgi:cytochrome c-type biogenesis protein CcmH/NrfF